MNEAIRGRGAAENPPNRFERLSYDDDCEETRDAEFGDPDEDRDARPPTVYYRDPTRTALARNQSPDVAFDVSINPYRGCQHGCVYCLGPDTPVLRADMTWCPIGDLEIGDVLVGFDELPEPGRTRKLRPAVVEDLWWLRKHTQRLYTASAEIITTPEHRWLQDRGYRWWRTEQLAPGRFLRRVPVVEPEPIDDDYRVGYVAGLSLGDGTFRYQPGWRSDKLGFPAAYWRVALIDREPLERLVEYLPRFGIEVQIRPFSAGPQSPRPLWKVETRSLSRLASLRPLLLEERSSPGYERGFLAGFFDAEGHSSQVLRISQVDLAVLERVRRYAQRIGFRFRLERRPGRASTLRLLGSLAERMRFFATVRPAIRRKLESVFGRTPAWKPERIEKVESGRLTDVVDIQTSTGTFYAAGIATHNCYARPTHEYLGFSAGLDFETKIMVKEEAPPLLRRELSSRSWKPQVIGLSGVTDAYQPIERRLEITRRCLQVLVEFRNPVGVVTKNGLVARDADLLAELARHDAASVGVSITSLDPRLQRVMEPRASHPEQRLRAVERLARAGVPTGVMVAPIIPGLNDHEVPAILAAAASAGAGFASPIMLRLPQGVKELFAAWLERHYPERKKKVLNRIREVRGGQLNDARFRSRMRGEGLYADHLHRLFELSARRHGLASRGPTLSAAAFRKPGGNQMALFG